MDEIKRYYKTGCGSSFCDLVEHEDGNYVLYEDHLKAIAEAKKECKRNEPSLREVCELFKECDAECWRSFYKSCKKCILQGSDGRCLKTQLRDAINEDYGIDKVITLYNQIRERISNESKNN